MPALESDVGPTVAEWHGSLPTSAALWVGIGLIVVSDMSIVARPSIPNAGP